MKLTLNKNEIKLVSSLLFVTLDNPDDIKTIQLRLSPYLSAEQFEYTITTLKHKIKQTKSNIAA